jgi:hypothetical protein
VVELDALVAEDPDGQSLAFAQDAEEDVLGAYVAVLERQGFAERKLQDLLGARGQGDVAARGAGRLSLLAVPSAPPGAREVVVRGAGPGVQRTRAEGLFDGGADGVEVDADGAQRHGVLL